MRHFIAQSTKIAKNAKQPPFGILVLRFVAVVLLQQQQATRVEATVPAIPVSKMSRSSSQEKRVEHQCSRKKRHETREAAEEQRQHSFKYKMDKINNIDIYECKFCSGWHLGHKLGGELIEFEVTCNNPECGHAAAKHGNFREQIACEDCDCVIPMEVVYRAAIESTIARHKWEKQKTNQYEAMYKWLIKRLPEETIKEIGEELNAEFKKVKKIEKTKYQEDRKALGATRLQRKNKDRDVALPIQKKFKKKKNNIVSEKRILGQNNKNAINITNFFGNTR